MNRKTNEMRTMAAAIRNLLRRGRMATESAVREEMKAIAARRRPRRRKG